MKDISYIEAMSLAMEQLSRGGAFLTVPGDNAMTIGWGAIGYYWKKPVFVAAVRPSRYTYGLIEQAGYFGISVPMRGDMKNALALAGSLSGRDGDKFSRCGLVRVAGRFIPCPMVDQCQLYFECQVRLKQDMTLEGMDGQVQQSAYPQGDLHRLYFGEILGCYRAGL